MLLIMVRRLVVRKNGLFVDQGHVGMGVSVMKVGLRINVIVLRVLEEKIAVKVGVKLTWFEMSTLTYVSSD